LVNLPFSSYISSGLFVNGNLPDKFLKKSTHKIVKNFRKAFNIRKNLMIFYKKWQKKK
jgi:hypothetical protein